MAELIAPVTDALSGPGTLALVVVIAYLAVTKVIGIYNPGFRALRRARTQIKLHHFMRFIFTLGLVAAVVAGAAFVVTGEVDVSP